MTYVYNLSDRSDVLPHVPPGTTSVLDVGCGRGGFLGDLRRSGPGRRLSGIEVHPEAAMEAAMIADNVVTGSFPEDMPEGEKFDCVSFLDVLEHLEDLIAALWDSKRWLAPEGKVLACIPNVQNFEVSAPLLLLGRSSTLTAAYWTVLIDGFSRGGRCVSYLKLQVSTS